MLSRTLATPRALFRALFGAVAVLLCVYVNVLYVRPRFTQATPTRPVHLGDQQPWEQVAPHHPIDDLIRDARASFAKTLAENATTLADAAAKYRARRGRHPPPGYDAWFAYAQTTGAIVVESFFDRIHQDIGPLWALDARAMRTRAHTQPQRLAVRNGRSVYVTDNEGRPPWIQNWNAFVDEFAAHLPDMDIVVNVMDETRLLVPWETIDAYMQAEAASRTLVDPARVVSHFSGLHDVDGNASVEAAPYTHSWITNDANGFWNHLRAACAPETPARNAAAPNLTAPVEFPLAPSAAYTTAGFVSNITAARDPCVQPHLRTMHGTFIESVSMSTSHELLPMFAGCKLPQNNEILIPGAMYLTDDPFYSGGKYRGSAWEDKTPQIVWRGTASGGRHHADTWHHFQRHRWVQMTNGTTVAAVDAAPGGVNRRVAPTFQLPAAAALAQTYESLGARLAETKQALGDWVRSWTDTGFVDLECFPGAVDAHGKKVLTCDYVDDVMAVLPPLPMKAQYDFKFLPDVDGNSYSARWRSFLRSSSMPLKATIYVEWHDDRLVPWVHYVPFDNSYLDLYGVMDYFLPTADAAFSRDAIAKQIAVAGQAWAEAVLRREDMHLYVWLLFLEYARVVDDQRAVLGFVGDLQ